MDKELQGKYFFLSSAFIIAVFLLANVIQLRWQYSTATLGIDYYTNWSVARAVTVKNIDNLYSISSQEQIDAAVKETSQRWSPKLATVVDAAAYEFSGVNRLTGSPFLLAVIGFLSNGDYERDHFLFVSLCFIFFNASVLILCYLLNYSLTATILLLTFFNYHFAPIASDVNVSNVNQLQLFIISIFIFFTAKYRFFLAGTVIGLGIMFKPNLAMILFCIVAQFGLDASYRRLQTLILGATAGALAACFCSIAYFGNPAIWADFAESLTSTLNINNIMLMRPLDKGNYGMPVLIYNLTGRDLSMIFIVGLLCLFVLILFLIRKRDSMLFANSNALHGIYSPEKHIQKIFISSGTGIAIMLLASNLAWLHYYALLIPLLLYLLKPINVGESFGWISAGKRSAAFLSLFMFSSQAAAIIDNVLYVAVIVNSAAFLLLLLAFSELWWRKP